MRNQQATQVLFELSKAGRRATRMPASDVPIDAASGLMPDLRQVTMRQVTARHVTVRPVDG